MGRNKVTDEVLDERYWDIVNVLKEEKRFLYADELREKTRLKAGQIGKALQYGRRKFDSNEIKIKDYVMASPSGYFLPVRGAEVVAYVAQVFLDVNSRAKTIAPIYEYAKQKWPDELEKVLNDRFSEDEDDSMEPWGVFNKIIEMGE